MDSFSVPAPCVRELARRYPKGRTLSTVEESGARIAAPMHGSVRRSPHDVVLVPALALLLRASHPRSPVAHKCGDRALGLISLDWTEPGLHEVKNAFNTREPFDQPLEVIGITVALDPSLATECLAQAREHGRRGADSTVLAGRAADAVP